MSGYRLTTLKAAREGAGFTQDYLAHVANSSLTAVQRLEDTAARTRPFTVTPEEAARLANAVGTDLDGVGAEWLADV
jgi:hypothetical protein